VDSGDPTDAGTRRRVILTAGAQIHLDSSFLIRAGTVGTRESDVISRWHDARRIIGISTLAWGEFLCGPRNERPTQAGQRAIHRFIPLGVDAATLGAELFNDTGRRTRSFADCLIAATAILDGAALATSNPKDFERFVDAGLELAE
jgi:predicted nucleic acid-binding protein